MRAELIARNAIRRIIRFESKFLEQQNGCWQWAVKSKTGDGYGTFLLDGKLRLAHRVAYELYCGPIPDGMLVCHTCDNPGCVNPDHLFLGTWKSNMEDKIQKGRHKGCAIKGEANISAKLTEEQVRDIKCELSAGGKVTHISVKYGVSHAQISKIKNGTRWGHISG